MRITNNYDLKALQDLVACKTEMINFLINDLDQRKDYLSMSVKDLYQKKIDQLRLEIIELKVKITFYDSDFPAKSA